MSRRRHQNGPKQADAPAGRSPARSIVLSTGLTIGVFAAYLGIWGGAPRDPIVEGRSAQSAVSLALSAPSQPSFSSEVTLDQARKNPSRRQSYLDRICEGSGFSAVYDNDGSLIDARADWILDTFSPLEFRAADKRASSFNPDITKTAASAVPSSSYYMGKGVDEKIYVFDRFFKCGYRVSRGRFEIIDSVSPSAGSREVLMVQTDDDARALIVGHEGRHLEEVRKGLFFDGHQLDSRFIRKCKMENREYYDATRELVAYMGQLRGYSDKMNACLAIQTYSQATRFLGLLDNAKFKDPLFNDYIRHLVEGARTELPRFRPPYLRSSRIRK